MELDKIITLIQTMSESNLTAFTLEEGNIKLKLEKNLNTTAGKAELSGTDNIEYDFSGSEIVSHTSSAETSKKAEGLEAAIPEVREKIEKGEPILSPLVGTFYSAPSPDDNPFVVVGERVKKGQVLGLIEAMKLMNEIVSEKDGVIEAILVENEQIVEYGQELFRIS